ncbi:MAG: carbonic anhydrase [Saprospiraceae bacterium]|nr:carbonic anhydrase [Saprospiraceae bacterium]
MHIIENLLHGNRNWVEKKNFLDRNFFKNLSEGQNPEIFWIGCSDSRVPANEITNTQAGEVFVHRNIANMVVHTDMNLLSVLDYAVNMLHVKHIIVCGHYLCGGVKCAMDGIQHGLVDNWIRHIKDVYRLYQNELDAIDDEDQRFDRFVELNVQEQVFDLTKTTIIQNAWEQRNEPKIHGWVFDTRTGFIKDLGVSFDNKTQVPRIYKIKSKIVLE